MEKRVKNSYYWIGIVVILVIAVISVLIMITGNTGAQVNSESMFAESVGTSLMPSDSIKEVQVEKEVDEIDDTQTPSDEVSAEMSDSEVPLVTGDPLAKALRSGKPVLADFGRGTCIPCKMMQPILEKLQMEYTGKAEILILDVNEYAALLKEYRIMVIPTQIFFDSSGKEVIRHLGFMPEEAIVAQLKAMGVE